MKFGLFGIGSGISARPDVAIKMATLAEDAGFESVWTGEHVVLPDPRQAPSPADPEHPMLHPSTVLAHVAATTSRIKLGTGITLIAQRNPLVLAKEMGSLDILCDGRLILGIGAGYLHQEFKALGVDFHTRGARSNEYIEVMQALWTLDKPQYSGRFYQFENINAHPRPIQSGGPPIVVGGTSDGALQRAKKYGQGWYGFAMTVEQTKAVLTRLAEMGASDLEISVTPPGRLEPSSVSHYADIGVHRLIALTPQHNADSLYRAMESMSTELGL